MSAALANTSELYLDRGGPMYRLMQRIGLIRGDDPSIRRRVLCFIAITWPPLLVLTLIEGYALGPTPRQSFLMDFATYVRFGVVVPLLFLADLILGPRLRSAGLRFIEGGFVRPADYPAFDRAIARLAHQRESVLAELILLALALTAAWTVTPETIYGKDAVSWLVVVDESGSRFTMAGLWYKFIAIPLMQLLLFRWLWRIVIWTRFLFAVSRLDLDLVPTHADQAGGLGFLGVTHISLAIFAIAFSAILSSDAAFRLVFENTPIETFKAPFIGMLVGGELICLGPLLVFSPIMVRKRREALGDYGLLVARYNRAFHQKWVPGPPPNDEPLLGSADIQSLADLGAGFEYVRSMKPVPFSLRVIIHIAVVVALPAVPLLPLVMPWSQILDLVAGALL